VIAPNPQATTKVTAMPNKRPIQGSSAGLTAVPIAAATAGEVQTQAVA
jgi:hypothetical protein